MKLDQIRKDLINITVKAGDFVVRNIENVKRSTFKGRRNLVTSIDKRSEQMIKEYLMRKFKDIPFLAEELNYKNVQERGWCWVVDPLDGTNNFVHGYPVFCVSCALVKDKNPQVGVVYDPMRKELFWAQANKGAYLGSKRIRTSRTKKLKNALLCTGFYYEFETQRDTNIEHFINFLYASQGVRRSGSAALDLCYVACGRLDGFWELYLKPWDTAAGSLIVEEAGGKVSQFNGENFDIFSQSIVASNALLHKQMLKILNLHNIKIRYNTLNKEKLLK